jgi:hypothetical protein
MPEFVMAQDVPAPPSMASTGDWGVPVVLMTLPELVMVRGLSVATRTTGPGTALLIVVDICSSLIVRHPA